MGFCYQPDRNSRTTIPVNMADNPVQLDDENFPIVHITKGPVRGRRCLDYRGTPYYSFVRVPYYGVCPAGNDRFKLTDTEQRQRRRWTDPIDCTMNIEEPSLEFTEETCLFCNIFTPKLPTPDKKENRGKPVMVFLPGDNPVIDSRTELEKYGPQYLMTEEVVLVVVSYRTGILGFASVPTFHLKEEASGNACHSDIINFFEWLSYEIPNFGGSPREVTVFGQGLGAALIVDMMYEGSMWPNVTKVILQSINLDRLLFTDNRIDIKNYAEFCGLANDDHTEEQVLEILRALPLNELISGEKAYLKTPLFRQINFNFLKPLAAKLHAGPGIAAVMIGFNSNEGILDKILYPSIDANPEDVDTLLKHIWLPNNKYVGPVERSYFVPQVKDYFFEDQPPTQEKFMQIVSDLRHNIRTLAEIRFLPTVLTPSANIYCYRFDVDGEMNLVKRSAAVSIPGACFGDELGYLFKVPGLPEPARGSLEEATMRRMTRIWANFAKHGNPNREPCEILGNLGWNDTTEDLFHDSKTMRIMNIGKRLEYTGRIPELHRFFFWLKFWKRCGVLETVKFVHKLYRSRPISRRPKSRPK